MNYKKLYFEQRRISLNLEMQLMNLRVQMIEGERAEIEKGLKEFTDKESAGQKEKEL